MTHCLRRISLRVLVILLLIENLNAHILEIYINNTASGNNPDGSKENPYNSFSEAFNDNISSNELSQYDYLFHKHREAI